MHRRLAVCLVSLALAGPVWAQGKAQEQAPASGSTSAQKDISKMGPWSRKPTNERQTKKELEAFFKEEEELKKKGDLEASLARMDFPVFMATDDSKGMTEAEQWDRQRFTQEMKPHFEKKAQDHQVTHKRNITVLSDSMAMVTDDFKLTHGKQKLDGRMAGLLVKKDGKWLWKALVAPGWGDQPQTGTGGSGEEKKEHEHKGHRD